MNASAVYVDHVGSDLSWIGGTLSVGGGLASVFGASAEAELIFEDGLKFDSTSVLLSGYDFVLFTFDAVFPTSDSVDARVCIRSTADGVRFCIGKVNVLPATIASLRTQNVSGLWGGGEQFFFSGNSENSLSTNWCVFGASVVRASRYGSALSCTTPPLVQASRVAAAFVESSAFGIMRHVPDMTYSGLASTVLYDEIAKASGQSVCLVVVQAPS